VPAVKAMLTVGTNKVISTANALMGTKNAYQCFADEKRTITTQCYGSSAIGDGAFLHLDQHVNGDASLARLGASIPTTYILKINDSNNKPVYKWTQPKPTQVVRQDAAYIVNNMLSDPRASYLPGSCTATTCTTLARGGYKFQRYNGWDFAVKTGTTNNSYDGLMTAWSTQLAVVSWVGYHTDNQALKSGGMEYMTEPLTRTWIEGATDALNMKPVNWVQPSDIKVLPAFVQTTHVGVGSQEPGPSTDIFPAWYVSNGKAQSTNQTTDKVSGGIATTCTPELAKQTSATSNDSAFSADIFWPIGKSTSSGSANSTKTDDVHICGEATPTISINGSDTGTCKIDTNCPIQVTVIAGAHPLSDPNRPQFPGTINILVNGSVVSTYAIDAAADCGNASTCNITLQWTPSASLAGQKVSVTTQVIDSVLDSGTSNAVSLDITQANTQSTNSGNNGGNTPPKKP